MRSLLVFLPEEFIPMLIVAGGLAIIVGARRVGAGLVVTALLLALLPALLAPFFDALPSAVLTLLLVAMLIALVFAALRWLSVGLIGTRATDHMIGTLAADAVRWSVLGSFRLCGRAVLALVRLLVRPLRR